MKILILGLTGMLGHRVYIKFKESKLFSDIRGTIREDKKILERYSFFNLEEVYDKIDFELNGFEQLYNIINEYKPDIVVNCIVIKKDAPKEKFLIINSSLPHFIAKIIPKGSRLIQLSTDGVFSGKKGNYSETDVTDSNDIYAKSKFFGEIIYGDNLTIRTSIFGHELFDKKLGIVEWFLNEKKRANGFSNYFFSGVSTNWLSDTLIILIRSKFSGLVNICSNKISKYQFLKILNEVYSCQKEIINFNNEPVDRSLNPRKMVTELNIEIPDMKSMIEQMKNENV